MVLILGLAFSWKAHEALVKYSKKDTLMVAKQVHPKMRTFPSVTICKNVSSGLVEQQRVAEELDNWMDCQFQSRNV